MESIPRDHLNHFEAVTGMFHLQLAVLNLLFHFHMGDKSDPSSLAKWFIALKRDSNIYGTGKKNTIKDFRACNQLFNHVFDGHCLAIVATQLGSKSCAELHEALKSRNWREGSEVAEKQLMDLNYVDNLRKSDERDPVYENALLFLQHGFIYRDFCHAMRHGDSGRIKNCLTFFMLWFQGSKFTNYAAELVHLVACLNHLWSRDMREHWLRNVLVNFSGSQKSFLAMDLLGELVVREIKAWRMATITGASGEYLRNVMAPQVLLCSRVRDSISREVGATQYYKHSSSVSAWFDVRMVANSLLQHQILTFTPKRTFGHRSAPKQPSEVPDLYRIGVNRIWLGAPIAQYVAKRRNRNDLLSDHTTDVDVDGEEFDLDGLDEGENDGDEIMEMIEGLL